MLLPALSLIDTISSPTCLGDNQVSHQPIFDMMILIVGIGLEEIPTSAWHDRADEWWDTPKAQTILMLLTRHEHRIATLDDEIGEMFDHFANEAIGR